MVKSLLHLIMMAGLVLGLAQTASAEDYTGWDGLWFECEFSGRQAPPRDDCAMLDDDGFMFNGKKVTYMKVIDSTETDDCKKQRAGQCFQASAPKITVTEQRNGKAEFTENTIGLRFLGCTQIFNTTDIGGYIEARPDEDRCYWAGEKYFYLRQYQGEIVVE